MRFNIQKMYSSYNFTQGGITEKNIVIQIQWKLHFAVIRLLGYQFLHMSRHVQNFEAAILFQCAREQIKISIEFHLRWKHLREVGPSTTRLVCLLSIFPSMGCSDTDLAKQPWRHQLVEEWHPLLRAASHKRVGIVYVTESGFWTGIRSALIIQRVPEKSIRSWHLDTKV